MTRGNPSDLQPFDPEIDRTFHRLVRHHFIPFDHSEHSITGESVHSVIGDFEHPDFEHYNFEILILNIPRTWHNLHPVTGL